MPYQNKRICVSMIFIAVVLCATVALAEKPYRVLILPFTIHSDQDLSFLKKGIGNMLSTRLTVADEVVPISTEATQEMFQSVPESIDEAKALELGTEAGADYVVVGTLTVLGESISTDARFLDVKEKKPAVSFSQFGKDQSEVLFHIDLFAAQVNEKVFGRKTYTYAKPETTDEQAERRRHPDSLIPSDQLIITNKAAGIDFWRSRRFKTVISGLSVGDVDGDGRNEVAFVDNDNLMIYRQLEGKFEKVGTVESRTGCVLLGVDVADINQNGVSEIFVTSVSLVGAKMNSFVVEWNGTAFKKIINDQNWYYRVTQAPNRGKILVGQKRGVQDLFWKRVHELAWSQGAYRPVEQLKLPKGQKIFGFTFGDVMNTGEAMVVSYTDGDYLRVSDSNGRVIWSSGDRFGGTAVYVEATKVFDNNPSLQKPRYYLPQRVHVVDIDKDGKNDVITVKNEEAIPRTVASRLRVFKSGRVECLSWDTMGLRQKWKTRENSGYISDAVIADIDNDGTEELVFSLVSKSSPIIGSTRSYVVAMEVMKESS